MSEGTQKQNELEAAAVTNGGGPEFLTPEQLADTSKFQFTEKVIDLSPHVPGKIKLRSLSVEERESLPSAEDFSELNDRGERTRAAVKAAAEMFVVFVSQPKLSVEQAESFLGKMPTEAFDKVTSAYGELIGGPEEETEARSTFPQE